MAKRKISKQQRIRIARMQKQRLLRARQVGIEKISHALSQDLGPEHEGLLITHHGKYVDVEDLKGKIYRCHLRQHLGALIAGDHVIFRTGKNNTGVVVALCERQSLLWRMDSRGNKHPIAANINQMIVVLAPQPRPVLSLIDSYLVAAAMVNMRAVILFNKIDLLTERDKKGIKELLAIYRHVGYPVILTSTQTLSGFKRLKSILKNHNSIFVGQSGVGKSSLINCLIPDACIATAELSLQQGHGSHTTTRSQRFHLPSGGDLVDSPGIREFSLWHMSRDKIAQGFIEFREYLGQCKFRDCSHCHEEGCAIHAAVDRGEITKQRWQSFLAIAKENERNKFFYKT